MCVCVLKFLLGQISVIFRGYILKFLWGPGWEIKIFKQKVVASIQTEMSSLEVFQIPRLLYRWYN